MDDQFIIPLSLNQIQLPNSPVIHESPLEQRVGMHESEGVPFVAGFMHKPQSLGQSLRMQQKTLVLQLAAHQFVMFVQFRT